MLVLPHAGVAPLLSDGTNGAILDLVLPSSQTFHSVRFVDDMYARKWFYIIHTRISRSLPEIAEQFYASRHGSEIKALGWLAEQVSGEDSPIKSWRPVFLVVTDTELCFLSSTPVSRQACREVETSYPILCTR